ncbi:arginyltransferase [Thaumasiovibrio subtropicus]|uniref:arginyltransferase n=1 Tax=Thaumasiovibrio subtropicus TaxID=1891207 RepID=UPI000B353983|nr:arginyltransferase [Thaumasiovibrio subtropicus]
MSLQIGITPEKPCSYLPEQKDRLAVVMDEDWHSVHGYRVLMDYGFRRSGAMIYRPHCLSCSACHPVRVDVQGFTPSRSQKRLAKKLSQFDVVLKPTLDKNWFSLYSQYISVRHSDGSMYPPNEQDFSQFITASWSDVQFLHIYHQGKLRAIAVCDMFKDAMSALYTFFDPTLPLSMGKAAILLQLQYARQAKKTWLYLGYQVDQCKAMNYKVNFKPCQRWVDDEWHTEG